MPTPAMKGINVLKEPKNLSAMKAGIILPRIPTAFIVMRRLSESPGDRCRIWRPYTVI